ncbi:MAG: hypothetical protein WAX89_02530 [Alphaproteobacteria bacterium]
MNKFYPLGLLALLAGCSHAPERELLKGQPFIGAAAGNNGVVMAESRMGMMAGDVGTLHQTSCDDAGVGVQVHTNSGDKTYAFDTAGEPCGPAQVMFDGRSAADRRAPPPGIHVAFADKLGGIPAETDAPPMIRIDMDANPNPSGMPDSFAAMGEPARIAYTESNEGPDLEATLKRWSVQTEAERDAAGSRELSRLSTGQVLQEHQATIMELQSRLNDKVAQLELTQQDRLAAKIEADKLRAGAQIESAAADQQAAKLQAELLEARRRLADVQHRNQTIAHASETERKQYEFRLKQLQADLDVAEQRADKNRQAMVLEAAKKIAEAERLAFAARLAEKDAMEREAARKKAEGDMLMERALQMKQGQTVVVPGLADQIGRDVNPLPIDLADVPVVVNADNVPLNKIMEKMFVDATPLIGKWRVTWQLTEQNRFLLEETWTLNAEASMGEVLDYIQTRVKDLHGVYITFRQFEKSRLFVVADGGDAPAISTQ